VELLGEPGGETAMTRLNHPCQSCQRPLPSYTIAIDNTACRTGASSGRLNLAMASTDGDHLLQKRFRELLEKRAFPKTLCPSEVARSFNESELADLGVSVWRDLMPRLRDLAFESRDAGEVEILQKGNVVDSGIEDVRGPIRVRLIGTDRNAEG
jgi:hypothetical protein